MKCPGFKAVFTLQDSLLFTQSKQVVLLVDCSRCVSITYVFPGRGLLWI